MNLGHSERFAVCETKPQPNRWQGPELGSLLDLDPDNDEVNETIITLFLHERGWRFVQEATRPNEHARLYVNPMMRAATLVSATAALPPSEHVIHERLRDLGLGALADTINWIPPRRLTVDTANRRIVETLTDRRQVDAAICTPGQRSERTVTTGRHVETGSPYSHTRHGLEVHVMPVSVTAPIFGDHGDRLLDVVFAEADQNPAFTDSELRQLRTSLRTIALVTPDAMGLVGSGNYSGLRSTSLVSNLTHKTRAHAFAYELHAAARLANQASSDDRSDLTIQLRPGFERIDFGVRFQLAGQRRSVEADLLISTWDGQRHGIDVKYTSTGRGHPTRLSTNYLTGIRQVLDRGEIDTFHILTNTWVRPGNTKRLQTLVDNGYRIGWHSMNARKPHQPNP